MNYSIGKWFRNISITGKLYFVMAIMALLITTELVTLYFTIRTLSATRAYVGGEGLWSKAEKDAVFSLRKYAVTRQPKDYSAYINFLRVPLGDRKARVELEKEHPDMIQVRIGFLQGRNNREDIEGMIHLFRRFRHVGYIDQAISIWTKADSLIEKLEHTGTMLHQALITDGLDANQLDQYVNQIDVINEKLTVLEDQFSYTLGQGSRWLENLILTVLFSMAVTVEFTGLFLTLSVSVAISKGLKEVINLAAEVAKGNFSKRATVQSNDEIGRLGQAFNQMTEELNNNTGERIRAEEKLRQQKELYETLVKTQSEMGEGIAITENQKIIYVNSALVKMYGYDEREILHMPSFLDMIAPEERPGLVERLKERLAGQLASDTGETVVISKDGKRINIEYSLKQIHTAEGTRMISIIRDISARKRAEAELEQKTNELTRSNKDLQEFAYVASHDLKEPLRTVGSYVQLLQRRYQGKLDEEADEFISFAVQGVRKMDKLIGDLLTYSRVSTQESLVMEIDCNLMIGRLKDDLREIIRERGVQIVYKDLPTITANAVQISQLFQNLIINAIKFNESAVPEIRITGKENADEWTFTVSDNGIGIDERFSGKIFVIFQRLDRSEKYDGTGIGLAICKKIVERHGGTICFESEKGKGTSFYFTIRKNYTEF